MNSSVLRVLAVILAIGAVVVGYMGYQISKQSPITKPEVVKKVEFPIEEPVLVAARDIPTGHILRKDDLTIELQSKRPPHSYSNASQVVGRQANKNITSGEVILSRHVHDYSQLANNLNPGERAMAVRVDEVIGSGGFIEPGDRVDVLFYLHSGQEVGKNSSAQVLLTNVRVLAFGNVIESTEEEQSSSQENEEGFSKVIPKPKDEKKEKEEKPTGKKSKTAVLAIDESETSTLLLAETSGKLRLVIHGPDPEQTEADDLPQTDLLSQSALETEIKQKQKEKEFKHYVLLKELIQSKPDKKTTKKVKSRVIVHKGQTVETQTFKR